MCTTFTNILSTLRQQGLPTNIVDFCWQSSIAYTPQAQGVRMPIFGEDYAEMIMA